MHDIIIIQVAIDELPARGSIITIMIMITTDILLIIYNYHLANGHRGKKHLQESKWLTSSITKMINNSA